MQLLLPLAPEELCPPLPHLANWNLPGFKLVENQQELSKWLLAICPKPKKEVSTLLLKKVQLLVENAISRPVILPFWQTYWFWMWIIFRYFDRCRDRQWAKPYLSWVCRAKIEKKHAHIGFPAKLHFWHGSIPLFLKPIITLWTCFLLAKCSQRADSQ
jgi:hypothetical protein